jgi:uroporphyrinogen decarboxylase
VQMIAGKGPHFPDPLVVPADLEKLEKTVDMQKVLGYFLKSHFQLRV